MGTRAIHFVQIKLLLLFYDRMLALALTTETRATSLHLVLRRDVHIKPINSRVQS